MDILTYAAIHTAYSQAHPFTSIHAKSVYSHDYVCTCMSTLSSTWVLVMFRAVLSVGYVPCIQPVPSPLFLVGSCTHGGLQKVGRPFVLKLNWRGLSHKAGAWGRDSAPSPASFLYWVAPLRYDGR